MFVLLWKKRYLTLVLDYSESGSSNKPVKEQGCNDAHGCVISIRVWLLILLGQLLYCMCIYMAWASALLVLDWLGMPEPRIVGRVTVDSHAFRFMYVIGLFRVGSCKGRKR